MRRDRASVGLYFDGMAQGVVESVVRGRDWQDNAVRSRGLHTPSAWLAAWLPGECYIGLLRCWLGGREVLSVCIGACLRGEVLCGVDRRMESYGLGLGLGVQRSGQFVCGSTQGLL